MVVRFFFSVLLLIISASHAVAQSVQIFVVPDRGTKNDVYRLIIEVSGTRDSGPPRIQDSPDFDHRFIGPETSMSIINGSYSVRMRYNYEITPRLAGELTSPGAEVEIDGKVHLAPGVPVFVGDSPSQDTLSGALRLTQRISARDVFVGEQLVWTIELATRVPVYEASLDETTLPGIWSHSIGPQTQSSRLIDGVTYMVTQLNRALFPLVPGTISLPPRALKAVIPVEGYSGGFLYNDDLFSRLLGGQRQVRLLTDADQFLARPLPPLPRNFLAEEFSAGLVGPTSLAISAESTPLPLGQSREVTVVVQSEGNLSRLSGLAWRFPEGTEIFERPASMETAEVGGKLISKKTFVFSVTPGKPGVFTVPVASVGYFSPEARSYRRAATEVFQFEVTGELNEEEVETFKPSETGSKEVGVDHYRDFSLADRVRRRMSLLGVVVWIAIGLVVGASAFTLFRAVHRTKTRGMKRTYEVLGDGEATRRALCSFAGIPETSSFAVLRAHLQTHSQDKPRAREAAILVDLLEIAARNREEISEDLRKRVECFLREY